MHEKVEALRTAVDQAVIAADKAQREASEEHRTSCTETHRALSWIAVVHLGAVLRDLRAIAGKL